MSHPDSAIGIELGDHDVAEAGDNISAGNLLLRVVPTSAACR